MNNPKVFGIMPYGSGHKVVLVDLATFIQLDIEPAKMADIEHLINTSLNINEARATFNEWMASD